jgi:hypothetical protein
MADVIFFILFLVFGLFFVDVCCHFVLEGFVLGVILLMLFVVILF